jgi:SAM-dependent methyltransferase
MIEQARRKIPAAEADRVEMLLLDPERMVIPQRYDLIVSLMTLHHIPDAREIVKLLASSLTSGGILALADLDAEDGSFHGTEAEVHRGFDRQEIKGVMSNAGLEEIQDSTPWTMDKEAGGVRREYPLFLITGRSWRRSLDRNGSECGPRPGLSRTRVEEEPDPQPDTWEKRSPGRAGYVIVPE